jgi:hypothetical protein
VFAMAAVAIDRCRCLLSLFPVVTGATVMGREGCFVFHGFTFESFKGIDEPTAAQFRTGARVKTPLFIIGTLTDRHILVLGFYHRCHRIRSSSNGTEIPSQ